jgi:hypothetical protein
MWFLPVFLSAALPTLPVRPNLPRASASAVILHCVGCPTLHKARMKRCCGLEVLRPGGCVATAMMPVPSSSDILHNR